MNKTKRSKSNEIYNTHSNGCYSGEKSESELYFELEKKFEKRNNTNLIELIPTIKKEMKLIEEFFLKYYFYCDEESLISEILQIKKNQNSEYFDYFIIASLIRVNQIEFNFTPRKIQIISLLLFLHNNRLIEEIKTGEGKTLIISFLAVILSLKGKYVDILTSSPVLAARDSEKMQKLYKYYNIKASCCCNTNSTKNEGSLSCYKKQICYGDSLSFEGDILRSEFLGNTGRGERPYDCIIIDEIDNLCIDNLKNQTELVDNFPGYKFLEYIYLFIFNDLLELSKKYNNIDKNCAVDKVNIVNLLDKNIREFLRQNKKNENKIIFPEHLERFIYLRIREWCNSAYMAMFQMELNKNYIIKCNENGFKSIVPIDFSNTGTTQNNSVWSSLHPFLEIKHGLRLSGENLNSCFMSNLTFFKKYEEMYGLTGTLGSAKTQEAINKIYGINLIKIPTFKKKKLIKGNMINIPDKFSYKKEIIKILKEMTLVKNRAVLVICEYISQAEELYNYFRNLKLPNIKLILYNRSDYENESQFLNREIQINTIIFSTNLAGRGTDIRISKELERNGGLHVLITFMPPNKRVEDQAFGRAGRKGENGSAQIIMNSDESYENKKKIRDYREESDFDYLLNIFAPKTDLFQEFFSEFCDTMKLIKKANPTTNKEVFEDLREKWSLFVLENSFNNLGDNIDSKCHGELFLLFKNSKTKIFQEFIKPIRDLIKDTKNYEFHNPFLMLVQLQYFSVYEKVINKLKNLSIGAYYLRAYTSLSLGKKKIKYCQWIAYKDLKDLSFSLKKLLWQFDEYIALINNISKNNRFFSTDLLSQTKDKKKILSDLLENVDTNIEKFNEIISIARDVNVLARILEDKEILGMCKVSPINYMNFSNKEPKINSDILSYYADHGLCFTFNTKIETSEECECCIQ